MVANQLLDQPSEKDTTVTTDMKIPAKAKIHAKNTIKTRNEDTEEVENTHAGVAVPVSMEELDNPVKENESTTSNEGISTWVLVSSPINSNSTVSTEPTKTEESKKQKPVPPKNKNKKPPNKPAKRPVIGSTNKADLIAGGSAINENVYNKIKDTVLSNVKKNKTPTTQKITTIKSTTSVPTTEALTTKKEETKIPVKLTSTTTDTKVTPKPKRKKNKNKIRTTTEEPFINDSALLPMEGKGPEIELEVSTPPVTTKKPKRTATRKKNKTKKRKTTKPKPDEVSTSVEEIKTSNKTKSAKPAKKPQPVAITSQLYNYLSREVMPSVGVGVLGLASIVGIASYFFYPFSTPVRRTFEVDKRDDLYKNNAEDYANEGNGQAEEEMLGTVLAGMPAHAKNKLNPYAGQTAYINRYPAKKEQPQQDIRYRHVATKYEPNYNVRYPQQKTGLAHGAVYPKPVNYSPQYDTRHAYTTEGKFNFDKLPTSYAPYSAAVVEPIYAAPQTGSSVGVSSYGNDASNSVVYGVKPSAESDFKPVYPFEGHFYNEATNNPVTYAPTSLYLGSNNEADESIDEYSETSSEVNETDESKFVVGNVPKELSESATPAVVPEHGPRKLNRRKRNTLVRRSISTSLEELLRLEKENNNFISNEIDDSVVVPMPMRNVASIVEDGPVNQDLPTFSKPEEVFTVFAAPLNTLKAVDEATTIKTDIIESVSTEPINENKEKTTEPDSQNDIETTTKAFRVYEVFSPSDVTSSPIVSEVSNKDEPTTQRSIMTETTTELRSETTSILPSTQTSFTDDSKDPGSPTLRPTPIIPDIGTYPPVNEPLGIFSFLRRLIDFKVRLGLSILQSTSESLNRFLKNVETPQPSNVSFAKASKAFTNTKKRN